MEIFFSSGLLDKGEEVSAGEVWWTLIEGERHLCQKQKNKPTKIRGKECKTWLILGW